MNKSLRFGMLGYGGSGRAIARRLQAMTDTEVVAVYEPKMGPSADKEASTSIPDATLTDVLDDFWAMSMDAVVISTPDHTHFSYAKDALSNGFHTLIEKPMTTSIDDGEQLLRLSRETNLQVGVHHQKRYLPAFRAAYDSVRAGRIGKPIHVEVSYVHDMRERATRFDNWRVDDRIPQEVALGLSSHSYDLVRWISGQEVRQLFAVEGHEGWPEYPTNDANVTLMVLEGGCTAAVTGIISSAGPQIERVVVYGTEGQIRNNIICKSRKSSELLCKPVPKGRWQSKLLKKMFKCKEVHEYPFSVNEHELACTELLHDFAASIHSGKPFWLGVEEGIAAVKLGVKAMSSAKERAMVRIESTVNTDKV